MSGRQVAVKDLLPEARFLYRDTEVVTLKTPEKWQDQFGQSLLRLWARRTDTNAEGWVTFGPNAVIELTREAPRMFVTPTEFRTLLDLHMCSDPTPLDPAHDTVVGNMLTRFTKEARPELPNGSWVDAYHYYHPDRFGRVWWLQQAELCKECGQPDNCGDCNHERLEDVSEFGGSLV